MVLDASPSSVVKYRHCQMHETSKTNNSALSLNLDVILLNLPSIMVVGAYVLQMTSLGLADSHLAVDVADGEGRREVCS
jgi:hypothetical protein